MEAWIEYGYWGLFFAAFLAATILPLSSDALLGAMILASFDPVTTVTVGTFGNWLGGMSSYGLGYMGKWRWIEKYLRISEKRIQKMNAWVERRGSWLAFWCWLPIVGDPLAVALGLLRSPVYKVAAWMLLGKALRYTAIAWLALEGKTLFF